MLTGRIVKPSPETALSGSTVGNTSIVKVALIGSAAGPTIVYVTCVPLSAFAAPDETNKKAASTAAIEKIFFTTHLGRDLKFLSRPTSLRLVHVPVEARSTGSTRRTNAAQP